MSNISTDILRIIATTQTWVKDYAVVAALTRNANTPVALPLNLLGRLNDWTFDCCQTWPTDRGSALARSWRSTRSDSGLAQVLQALGPAPFRLPLLCLPFLSGRLSRAHCVHIVVRPPM